MYNTLSKLINYHMNNTVLWYTREQTYQESMCHYNECLHDLRVERMRAIIQTNIPTTYAQEGELSQLWPQPLCLYMLAAFTLYEMRYIRFSCCSSSSGPPVPVIDGLMRRCGQVVSRPPEATDKTVNYLFDNSAFGKGSLFRFWVRRQRNEIWNSCYLKHRRESSSLKVD